MKWRQRIIAETGEDPISVFRKTRKKRVVDAIGGCCQFCGYMKLISNLAFHHTSNKQSSLSERDFQRSWAKLIPEIRKCVLACHNCHGEIHAELHDKIIPQKLIEVQMAIDKLEQEIKYESAPTLGPPCLVCGTPCKATYNKYCSTTCCYKGQQKINWPLDEEFLKMIKSMSQRKVAGLLGVSDQAVAKHLKRI